ncbi:MarR family winged helix-turn-helix transcriptional regulator [Hoeflea ulvae]|uniref:MarR family transcriptional regulator n=1 Tax=Hoeflea ulvae TaxID=2983764 RepID=A0ABT3YMW6_9HYPH|nr:MarR family transcriptional regulator [Hoeflea ulvae]MCY0096917.1 MarR family transcriptional regulator [Hoeflea ulvae]
MDAFSDKDPEASGKDPVLPFEESVGYQIRQTSRLFQRSLQQKIEPHGVTLGMWYFLRALWHEDGMTQRELSLVVGTMEPTTLTAIKSMEKTGLVRRVKNEDDRRKINIYLTERGKALRSELMPLAKDVVDGSVHGFSDRERSALLEYLKAIQVNLLAGISDHKDASA